MQAVESKRKQRPNINCVGNFLRKSCSAKRVVRIDKNISNEVVDAHSDMASDTAKAMKATSLLNNAVMLHDFAVAFIHFSPSFTKFSCSLVNTMPGVSPDCLPRAIEAPAVVYFHLLIENDSPSNTPSTGFVRTPDRKNSTEVNNKLHHLSPPSLDMPRVTVMLNLWKRIGRYHICLHTYVMDKAVFCRVITLSSTKVKLFQIHARGYKVSKNFDNIVAPTKYLRMRMLSFPKGILLRMDLKRNESFLVVAQETAKNAIMAGAVAQVEGLMNHQEQGLMMLAYSVQVARLMDEEQKCQNSATGFLATIKFITCFKRYHSSGDCLPTKFPISPSRPLKLPVPTAMGQKRSKIKC
ncbi:hypothetical protein LXL04_028203 [Taraxacum kok-saghyz]